MIPKGFARPAPDLKYLASVGQKEKNMLTVAFS